MNRRDWILTALIVVGITVVSVVGYNFAGEIIFPVVAAVIGGIIVAIQLQTHRTIKHRVVRNKNLIYQTQSLLSLYASLDLKEPLPKMDVWSAAPDFLVVLVQVVREHKPALVVELGSGVSSVICARLLQESGGEIISLDQERQYADRTRRMLERFGIGDVADVIYAPLQTTEWEGESTSWYDREIVERLPHGIEMLVVDGPSAAEDSEIRSPALPLLYECLAEDCIIVVDDAGRAGESRMVEDWVKRFSEFEAEYVDTWRGVHILRRRSASL